MQGLTEYLRHRDWVVLQEVARGLRDGGLFLMIDALADNLDGLDAAFEQANLGLVGLGLVGGECLNHSWGCYAGLLLRKGARSRATAMEATERVAAWWGKFSEYANAHASDWTRRNTAYYSALSDGLPYELL
jgi:hypothetical protein